MLQLGRGLLQWEMDMLCDYDRWKLMYPPWWDRESSTECAGCGIIVNEDEGDLCSTCIKDKEGDIL